MLHPALQAGPIDIDDQTHPAIEGDGQRLGATHPAATASESQGASERSVELLHPHSGKSLISALQNALGADIDPGPRGHLAVHR